MGSPLGNSINFRDCGGFPIRGGGRVRTGVLYRSGSLDRLSAKERRLVLMAGLKTIVDLRPAAERARQFRGVPGIEHLTVPFDIDPIARQRILPHFNRRDAAPRIIEAMTSVYRDMVALCAPSVGALLETLEGAAYPLCINCRVGKDRTGYSVAIILRSLGVGDHDIVGDYLDTNHCLLPRVRRLTVPLRIMSLGLLPTRSWEAAFTAYEQHIRTAFAVIDEDYRGVSGYLDFCGVPEKRRIRLKRLLCEPPAGSMASSR